MRGQIQSLLEQGLKAARAGEKRRARDIFVRVIELDQRNEKAWLWLSSVVDTTADRIVCLENVLVIDPSNTYAAAGLQKLRQQYPDETATSSILPRLAGPLAAGGVARDTAAAGTAPAPAQRVCPRCGFRNPGWAYTCDQCGADLQPVDLRQALGVSAKPRGRSNITLLEAWGGAFILNRRWAFLPEVELARWGRSLAALLMGPLFASGWRALTTAMLRWFIRTGEPVGQTAGIALRCAVEMLRPALLLAPVCVPVALLTWAGARLAGGRQGLKIHIHLIAVAFSIWTVWTAVLVSLVTFALYLLSDTRLFTHRLVGTSISLGPVAALLGFIWLAQAVQTAHRLPAARALLITLVVTALGAALLFGLGLSHGAWFTPFTDMLVPFFQAWPGCGT